MPASVKAFFDEATFTASYVLYDERGGQCAIVDPVLDFDPAAGRTATTSAEQITSFIDEQDLSVRWILETHVHADHLSAAHWLRERCGGEIVIGYAVCEVQAAFVELFGLAGTVATDGSQFDRLVADGDQLELGWMKIDVLHTPGHTPACCTYLVDDIAFVGDTLFMPDFGSARTDFPGGDAARLYDSIQRILALPGATRLFLCHDYKAPGRDEYCWETTVAAQKAGNIHVHDGVGKADFIEFRTSRDADLPVPKLLLPAVQVNIRAGALPAPDGDGIARLLLPLNVL